MPGESSQARARAIRLIVALLERPSDLDPTELATELVDTLTEHVVDVVEALERARRLSSR
jgi:hypothetical protein